MRFSVDDFAARSSDELSLTRGDRIELIERDDDFGDGWFLGRHMQHGGTGLFPEGMPALDPWSLYRAPQLLTYFQSIHALPRRVPCLGTPTGAPNRPSSRILCLSAAPPRCSCTQKLLEEARPP